MNRGLAASLRAAFSIALLGGVLLGSREGVLSLRANAFAQPGQYVWLYLAVPILAWVGLAAVLLLPLGLLGATRRGTRRAPYAFALGFVGATSILLPEIAGIEEHLTAVGFAGIFFKPVLWCITFAAALVAAAAAGAATAWFETHRPIALRNATRLAAIAAILCVVPVLVFFAFDWKWGREALSSATKATAGAPNVVLISIDTLRADHLGSYGAPGDPTPHLDRLAREGVLFEQAITSSPWTLPAVASLLTGAYPRRHGAGVIDNGRSPLGRSALRQGSWTIAGALRQAGYRTHAIVTNPYLSLRYGMGQGFDDYHNVTIEAEAYFSFRDTTALRLVAWAFPAFTVVDRGEVISARAQRWLESAGAEQPFFLWLHYVDPHPPYHRAGAASHKSFRGDMISGGGEREIDLTLTSPDVARLRSGELRLNLEEKEAVRGLYRAEVRSVDRAVGTVLDELDRLGLAPNTLVVVVADHGEEFWEHGGVEHGHTVYDEVVRVPLLMRLPGRLNAGARVRPIVSVIDVAPTILALAALPAAPSADGTSVLPLVGADDAAPRELLIENMLFADERVGLRTQAHKYVQWEIGKEEAYDLRDDPRELRDLAALDTVLLPLRHLYARADAAAPASAAAPTTPPLDGATVEAMRALGYAH